MKLLNKILCFIQGHAYEEFILIKPWIPNDWIDITKCSRCGRIKP